MEKNKQLENINVKIINSKIAKAYTVKNHYMKTFPNPLVCFGVFYNKLLSGVITFGLSPSTEQKIKKIVPKINRNEFIEIMLINSSHK